MRQEQVEEWLEGAELGGLAVSLGVDGAVPTGRRAGVLRSPGPLGRVGTDYDESCRTGRWRSMPRTNARSNSVRESNKSL